MTARSGRGYQQNQVPVSEMGEQGESVNHYGDSGMDGERVLSKKVGAGDS